MQTFSRVIEKVINEIASLLNIIWKTLYALSKMN